VELKQAMHEVSQHWEEITGHPPTEPCPVPYDPLIVEQHEREVHAMPVFD